MKTQMIGNVGCYVDDKNVVSFQVGAGLDPTYIGYKERNMHFSPPPGSQTWTVVWSIRVERTTADANR